MSAAKPGHRVARARWSSAPITTASRPSRPPPTALARSASNPDTVSIKSLRHRMDTFAWCDRRLKKHDTVVFGMAGTLVDAKRPVGIDLYNWVVCRRPDVRVIVLLDDRDQARRFKIDAAVTVCESASSLSRFSPVALRVGNTLQQAGICVRRPTDASSYIQELHRKCSDSGCVVITGKHNVPAVLV